MTSRCSSCLPLEAMEGADPNGAIGDGEMLAMGEVVRRTGVTRKALRVYEDLGLVLPRSRTGAGYRLYDHEALRRLRLIGRAKLLGLSLAEMEEFVDVAERCCSGDHGDLVTIVERKLAETEQRFTEISLLRDHLRGVLDRLANPTGEPACEEALCSCA